jgi:hypothetical protein
MWLGTVTNVCKAGALGTFRDMGRGARRAALVRASAIGRGCAVNTGSVLHAVTTGTNKGIWAGSRFAIDSGASVSLDTAV